MEKIKYEIYFWLRSLRYEKIESPQYQYFPLYQGNFLIFDKKEENPGETG